MSGSLETGGPQTRGIASDMFCRTEPPLTSRVLHGCTRGDYAPDDGINLQRTTCWRQDAR
jgi:hypothetical protein